MAWRLVLSKPSFAPCAYSFAACARSKEQGMTNAGKRQTTKYGRRYTGETLRQERRGGGSKGVLFLVDYNLPKSLRRDKMRRRCYRCHHLQRSSVHRVCSPTTPSCMPPCSDTPPEPFLFACLLCNPPPHTARAHLPYIQSLLTRRRSPEAITLAHQPRQQRLAKRQTWHVSLVYHLLDCAVEQLFCDQLPQAAAARRLLACQTPEDLRRQSQLLLPRGRGK